MTTDPFRARATSASRARSKTKTDPFRSRSPAAGDLGEEVNEPEGEAGDAGWLPASWLLANTTTLRIAHF